MLHMMLVSHLTGLLLGCGGEMNSSAKKRLYLIIAVVFVSSIAIQLWMEATNRADSIGVGYTFYSALTYTIMVLIIVAFGALILKFIGRK